MDRNKKKKQYTQETSVSLDMRLVTVKVMPGRMREIEGLEVASIQTIVLGPKRRRIALWLEYDEGDG